MDENEQNLEVLVCRRCGRKLKTPEAREPGMGKICWQKSQVTVERRPLFQVGEGYAKSNT